MQITGLMIWKRKPGDHMKVNDFLAMLRKAESVKTLYVMGGWGFPLTDANKKRAYTNSYNIRSDRKPLIEKASADTFAFDCCGLPRSILWGWCGDVNAKNGGAVFGANGVPEYDAKQFMFQGCTEQSKDFSKIEAGEFLWLDGHCGVYLGDGLAIESTPKWKDGVQITAVLNIGKKTGYNGRTWTYHGHLKYVDYSAAKKYPEPPFDAKTVRQINFRKAASTKKADMIGSIKREQVLTIEEISGDFGKVSGYVYLPDNIEVCSMDGYTIGNTYKVLTKNDTLNVRTAANTDATIVTSLKSGTAVVCKALTHDDSGNTWMRIDSPVAGWIAALYEGNKYVG